MTSSSNDNKDGKAGASESARRVLELLLAFTREQHTQSVKELAATTAIPLPTVYRYVSFLRGMGLLVERGDGLFSLSARVIGLAQAAEAAESLIDVAHPVMERLSDEVGETVILVRLIAGAAVCVHRIESQHHLRISFEPGQPLPAQRGASGRLLLASLGPAELTRKLQGAADPDTLAAEVALAGERRWATSSEEIDRGVWAAAAAIVESGRIVASLSVPSPLVRANEEAQEQLLDQVRTAAAEISALLR
jgi:DNA-binding IclR family transcriptional regulator